MDNLYVARHLREIGDMLAIRGENPHRIRAYRQAARTVERLPCSLAEWRESRPLQDLKGVGRGLAGEIEEFLQKGETRLQKTLEEMIPPPLLQMSRMQGLGPQKARALYKRGLHTQEDVRRALSREQLDPSLKEILNRALKVQGEGPFLLPLIDLAANTLGQALDAVPAVERWQLVGSSRRGGIQEEIMTMVVATPLPMDILMQRLSAFPSIRSIASAEGRGKVLPSRIPFQLLLAQGNSYFTQIVEATGPEEHWKYLKEQAGSLGLSLTSLGLSHDHGQEISLHSEEDLYAALHLPYLIPQIRQRTQKALQDIREGKSYVMREDIQGDFHVHTSWSDGGASLEAMAKRAGELGYEYLAITDHSPSLQIAGGVSPEALQEQMEHIDRLNEKGEKPYLLKGMEVDILPDGSLDLPQALLEGLDWVVASVHRALDMPLEKMMKRLARALHNPRVMALGHPTGRLFPYRKGYTVDMPALFKLARETGTALEINGSPDRRDLQGVLAREAEGEGVDLVMGSDAHGLGQLDHMEYCILEGWQGGISPGAILNTRNLKEVQSWLDQRHGGG